MQAKQPHLAKGHPVHLPLRKPNIATSRPFHSAEPASHDQHQTSTAATSWGVSYRQPKEMLIHLPQEYRRSVGICLVSCAQRRLARPLARVGCAAALGAGRQGRLACREYLPPAAAGEPAGAGVCGQAARRPGGHVADAAGAPPCVKEHPILLRYPRAACPLAACALSPCSLCFPA